jgi:hypothetical protein
MRLRVRLRLHVPLRVQSRVRVFAQLRVRVHASVCACVWPASALLLCFPKSVPGLSAEVMGRLKSLVPSCHRGALREPGSLQPSRLKYPRCPALLAAPSPPDSPAVPFDQLCLSLQPFRSPLQQP